MNDKRSQLHLLSAIENCVAALTLLAFGLRVHRLDFQPLWGDEGWSFYFASVSLADMLPLTAQDIHPPVYYALLSGWLRLVGSTPELARFLSVVFGVVLIPLSYRVASRLYDRVTGVATAAVVTLAPFAVYYSQEVRMYGLVTLLGLGSVYFFIQLVGDSRKQPSNRRPDKYALAYILTTSAALYTMYYAILIPLFQLVYFVIANRRRRLRDMLAHPFFRALSVSFLLYLPWIVYSATKLSTYVQGKRLAEGYSPLDPLSFFASHLIAFSLGHLSDTTRVLAWATILFLPLALLGLAYRPAPSPVSSTQNARRNAPYASCLTHRAPNAWLLLALYLLLPLLLGYLINLVYPFNPRHFERTWMIAAPAWWLILGAGLAWLWRWNRLVLTGAAAGMLLITTVMLLDFYNVPRHQDVDYRPLMAYVRAHSSPEDVFLASYQWQVGLYHAYLSPPRPALYVVPGWGETWAEDATRMQADLDTLINRHPRLWFPAYQALGRLWETEVETYLDRSAFPVQVDWNLPDTKLLVYARGDQLTPSAAPLNFANRLQLAEVEVGGAPVAAGRGVMPVSLTWRKLGNLGSDHRVALRLTDAGGRTWASRDSLPQGGDASFTTLGIGEGLIDHHGLLVPAGTPPGEYQLRLSVHDEADDHPLDLLDDRDQPQGVEAVLATVQVVQPETPLAPDALPVQYPRSIDFDGRVHLLGYSLGDGPFQAGDTLEFSLFWQARADVDEVYVVFAQLQDEAGQPVALSETSPTYPSDRWSAGTLLRDPHQIPLPATLPAGTYRLAVGLLRPDHSRLPVAGGGDQVVLTSIETTQRAHNFSAPQPLHRLDVSFGDRARLVGYDLRGDGDARPGESLTLVLYWQALEGFDRAYTVFAHLVNGDDQIFGQRDQVPGGGNLPTTSWVADEYLTDVYAVPINPDTPPGDYWIEIGFYNSLDGARLSVTDAAGQPIGDRLLLRETPVRVTE